MSKKEKISIEQLQQFDLQALWEPLLVQHLPPARFQHLHRCLESLWFAAAHSHSQRPVLPHLEWVLHLPEKVPGLLRSCF